MTDAANDSDEGNEMEARESTDHIDALAGSAPHSLAIAAAPSTPAESPSRPAALVGALVGSVTRTRRSPSWGLTSFCMLVVVPTLVFGVYLLFFVSPRYETEFRVAVRSGEAAKMSELPSFLGLAQSSQLANDSHAVIQYLQSRGALEDLDDTAALRAHYSRPSRDWWSRLDGEAPVEGFLRYWRRMLDAYFEPTTGTITVRVAAFDPGESLKIATVALSLSERFVNAMSSKSRDDSLAFARDEVGKMEARLEDVNLRLTRLRDKDKVLDARSAAAATLSVAEKLKTLIATTQASLATQSLALSPDAPSIVATRKTVAGLQQELDRINAELTASSDSKGAALSSVIADFSQLENEHGFAEKAYQSALAALETAREEAARQQLYLATIVRPELPEEPSFPRPLRQTATFFGVALALWAVATLLVSAVRQKL